jgi:hypothetical protein
VFTEVTPGTVLLVFSSGTFLFLCGIIVVQVSIYEVNIFVCAETPSYGPSASCNFETVSGITGVCSPNQIVI